jgi:hypothetical protein
MDEIVAWLSGFSWWPYVSTVIVIATAITAVLPSTMKDKPWYNVMMKVVNLAAGAVGKGKPADDKTKIVIK